MIVIGQYKMMFLKEVWIMKELTKEVVTREVTGYEAFDGKFFKSKEECEKYEKSAKGVAAAGAMEYKIGDGCESDLYDNACYDNGVEIFDVKNSDILFKLNMYISLQTNDPSYVISDKFIGEKVIIIWGYDRDWCCWYTLDKMIDDMKKGFEKMIERMEEKKTKAVWWNYSFKGGNNYEP